MDYNKLRTYTLKRSGCVRLVGVFVRMQEHRQSEIALPDNLDGRALWHFKNSVIIVRDLTWSHRVSRKLWWRLSPLPWIMNIKAVMRLLGFYSCISRCTTWDKGPLIAGKAPPVRRPITRDRLYDRLSKHVCFRKKRANTEGPCSIERRVSTVSFICNAYLSRKNLFVYNWSQMFPPKLIVA